ncbi:collagen alpha-2(I) chain-like [Lutra lutra]|uniref:collagen alpha-2(I) chain-like n=1 Tax=Lutra lutra TaxID=9657 RepID=UPI001FD2F287|nr:collagen alpha-2(I) chain-like [Lutra lutra]XP_047574308.1 collagen alpha-2(I) chain-like [Lutra lutra]
MHVCVCVCAGGSGAAGRGWPASLGTRGTHSGLLPLLSFLTQCIPSRRAAAGERNPCVEECRMHRLAGKGLVAWGGVAGPPGPSHSSLSGRTGHGSPGLAADMGAFRSSQLLPGAPGCPAAGPLGEGAGGSASPREPHQARASGPRSEGSSALGAEGVLRGTGCLLGGGLIAGGRPWEGVVCLYTAAALTADLWPAGLCAPCGRCRTPASSQPGAAPRGPRCEVVFPPVQGVVLQGCGTSLPPPGTGAGPVGLRGAVLHWVGVTDPEATGVGGRACLHGQWGRPAPWAPSASSACERVDGSDLVGLPGSPASRLVPPGSRADRSLSCVCVCVCTRVCVCMRAHVLAEGLTLEAVQMETRERDCLALTAL